MSDHRAKSPIYRLSDLTPRKPHRFCLTPDAPARADLAQEIGITGIRKLSFEGVLEADGNSDWRLEATLGATVVQPCVVTLKPVATRIDQPVIRRFMAGLAAPDEGEEFEIPQDETREALPDEIDPTRIMVEALTLALPDYPRGQDAILEIDNFTAPGVTPMSDQDTKPFAGLAGLRDKLGKSD